MLFRAHYSTTDWDGATTTCNLWFVSLSVRVVASRLVAQCGLSLIIAVGKVNCRLTTFERGSVFEVVWKVAVTGDADADEEEQEQRPKLQI